MNIIEMIYFLDANNIFIIILSTLDTLGALIILKCKTSDHFVYFWNNDKSGIYSLLCELHDLSHLIKNIVYTIIT